MTRLEDAFDDLIAQHPAGDPDRILASARHRAAADRTHRRTRLGLAAAVLLVAAAITTTVIATRDDPSDRVRTGGGPGATEPEGAASTIRLFFTDGTEAGCQQTLAVERPYDPQLNSSGALGVALRALLDGPTPAEVERGATSPFSDASRALGSIEVSGGVATVDLDPSIVDLVPNASTSCGSASIVSELEATVAEHADVDQVVLTLGGEREAFFAWLGIESPADDPTATTTAPLDTDGSGYAIASVFGVSIRTGDDPTTDLTISRDPAASAYAIGTGLVVYQGTDATVSSPAVPPVASGAVVRWSRTGTGTVTLPVPKGTDRSVLLDADRVDGRPKALVALHRGEGPDASRETLALIDLETFETETVAERSSWQSAVIEGRILPGGDVVGVVREADETWSIQRWTRATDEPVWRVPRPRDEIRAVAIDGEAAVLVENDARPGSITTYPLDLETGELGTADTRGVDQVDLWCSDWYDDELSCSRFTGAAGAIDGQGAWRELRTPTGAIVTASR